MRIMIVLIHYKNSVMNQSGFHGSSVDSMEDRLVCRFPRSRTQWICCPWRVTSLRLRKCSRSGTRAELSLVAFGWVWLSPRMPLANEALFIGIPEPKNGIILVVTVTWRGPIHNRFYTSQKLLSDMLFLCILHSLQLTFPPLKAVMVGKRHHPEAQTRGLC